jgi:hypothetical protein
VNVDRRNQGRTRPSLLGAVVLAAAVLALITPSPAVGSDDRADGAKARTSRVHDAFDVRLEGSSVGASRRVTRARTTLARSLGRLGVVAADRTTGTLRVVARLDGYLTGPSARPAPAVALDFVRTHLISFGLTRADLRTLRLRADYVDVLGTHHLSWVQRTGGLPVFGGGLEANVAADGRLINVTGSPVPALRAPATDARIDAAAAVAAARRSVGAPAHRSPADRAEPALFPTPRGARAAWRTVTRVSFDETYLAVVDAGTGDLLWRANMTKSDTSGTGTAWQYHPGDGVPAGGGVAGPVSFPVVDGTALSGNIAHVYADVQDDGRPKPADEVPALSGLDWAYGHLLITDGTGQNCSPTFPCTWDKATPFSWVDNGEHFGVQLYYFLNRFHDHLVAPPIAFTEAAGNFQVQNASGEGEGHDPIQGQFLDGAAIRDGLPDPRHTNNANMTTLEDGVPPVMQMYLWREASYGPTLVSAHSGDDAVAAYHEHTHGLSSRLVTFPDGLPAVSSAQAAAMGEGWSDWYALDYLASQGYVVDGSTEGDVLVGPYLTGGAGIRSEAIDCPVGSIASGCPGTEFAGAGGYTYGDLASVAPFQEVHADGEIWGQTLWDLRQALGSTTAETLITRAMELSPAEPSFLDMRNAILQADVVAFDGVDHDAIWSIFAERGMGYFASSRDGHDITVVEDFALPPTCESGCGEIRGRIRDQLTERPLRGVRVGVAGLNTGFGNDLADLTDARGRYRIADVPFHTYPEVVVDGRGFEPRSVRRVKVDGVEVLERGIVRDWAALEGGARIVRFTRPDYSFAGCGPSGAFDLSLLLGWGSDAPKSTFGSNVTGPRSVVVKLPRAVDVASFGFDPGATCGDPPDAAVDDFEIQTRTANGRWITAFSGHGGPQGELRTLMPKDGTENVRYVRLVLESNRGHRLFMDASELTVRGS